VERSPHAQADQHEQEDGDRKEDDRAPRGRVRVERDDDTGDRHDHADRHAQDERAAKTPRHELRGSDGDDHQRADEEHADDAHRDDDGERTQRGEQQVEPHHRQPARSGELIIVAHAEQGAAEDDGDGDDDECERSEDEEILRRRRRDAAEQVLIEAARPRRCLADEHHAGADAAVEQDRQGDLPARLSAGADQLDRHRPGDGGDERDRNRRAIEHEAESDTGDGDVAEAVTDQRQPPLHEEDPDGGGGDSDQQGGDQGSPHERVVEEVQGRDHLNNPNPWSASGPP